MKLNDPFGRMARRREREYDSLRQSLLKAGLTDRQQAEALLETLKKRSKTGLWVVIPLTLVAALLLQEYAIFIGAFGLLATLWLTNTLRRGQEYISRYIQEECNKPADMPAAENAPEEEAADSPEPEDQHKPPHSG